MTEHGSDNPDQLQPDEFYIELRSIVRRLGSLAVFLNQPMPPGIEDFGRLSKPEFMALYIRSHKSLERLAERWEYEADRLIAQALEAGSVFPVSSNPR